MEHSGTFETPSGRFGLVASRFNGFIVEHLVAGARDALLRHGVAEKNIDVVHVPGALEIPLIIKHLAERGGYVALIALGAVIRGETSHYDIVCQQSARGIAEVSLSTGIPVINAILTTNTVEQAVNRAGAKQGNKGAEAALAAIEMVNLIARLPDPKRP